MLCAKILNNLFENISTILIALWKDPAPEMESQSPDH